MIQAERMNWRTLIDPATVNNGSFTSRVVDTAIAGGAKAITFAVLVGSTDIALTTLRVRQSETKSSDTALGGTPTTLYDVQTKPGATDDSKLWLVTIDLKQPHARYLQLDVAAGNGTSGAAVAALAAFDHPGVVEDDLGAAVHESG